MLPWWPCSLLLLFYFVLVTFFPSKDTFVKLVAELFLLPSVFETVNRSLLIIALFFPCLNTFYLEDHKWFVSGKHHYSLCTLILYPNLKRVVNPTLWELYVKRQFISCYCFSILRSILLSVPECLGGSSLIIPHLFIQHWKFRLMENIPSYNSDIMQYLQLNFICTKVVCSLRISFYCS